MEVEVEEEERTVLPVMTLTHQDGVITQTMPVIIVVITFLLT
jgi:hypothetical protein